jgi:hypothetical protein
MTFIKIYYALMFRNHIVYVTSTLGIVGHVEWNCIYVL